MKHSSVYIKTDKGQLEIATRAHQLARRARALLIMIDGQRTAMDIMANSSSVGEISAFFGQLIDEGFIRELGAAPAPNPPAAAQASAPAAPRTDALPPDGLQELKRYVLLILRDVLGNRDAAAFRILIDAAQSAGEIGDIIPLHRDVPWNANNRQRSDDYLLLGRRLGQAQEKPVGARG